MAAEDNRFLREQAELRLAGFSGTFETIGFCVSLRDCGLPETVFAGSDKTFLSPPDSFGLRFLSENGVE